jgi:manganese/zinc/iron transport system permease protein
MGLIAVVVVLGLPAVGVVLMASLLILPGATARFWTDRLGRMLVIAVVVGGLIGIGGTLLSAHYRSLAAGPIITLVGTAFFAVSAVIAPRRGLLARAIAHYRFRHAIEKRMLLRVLFDLSEDRPPGRDWLELPEIRRGRSWDLRTLRRLLREAVHDGELEVASEHGYRLTPSGWEHSLPVVRNHRVWELFLREYGDLNALADPLAPEPPERRLPPVIYQRLVEQLRSEGRWPSDDLIPEETE